MYNLQTAVTLQSDRAHALRPIRCHRFALEIPAPWVMLTGMKQYRPDVEFQKLRYSMMKSRGTLRRLQGKSDAPDPNRKQIPDNSEPWLPGGVHSVKDALWISDQIGKDIALWRKKLQPAN